MSSNDISPDSDVSFFCGAIFFCPLGGGSRRTGRLGLSDAFFFFSVLVVVVVVVVAVVTGSDVVINGSSVSGGDGSVRLISSSSY